MTTYSLPTGTLGQDSPSLQASTLRPLSPSTQVSSGNTHPSALFSQWGPGMDVNRQDVLKGCSLAQFWAGRT